MDNIDFLALSKELSRRLMHKTISIHFEISVNQPTLITQSGNNECWTLSVASTSYNFESN